MRSISLLFLLLGIESCEFDDVPTVGDSSDWEYVGPGGMGAFSAVAVHSKRDKHLVGGSDVGGSFVSTNGGTHWEAAAHSHSNPPFFKNPLEVHDIRHSARDDRWYLATSEGVFFGDALGEWEPAAPLPAVSHQTNNDHFTASAQVVTPDPRLKDRVWVGMGRAIEPGIEGRVRHHPHKVYRSDDGGESWIPSLALPEATVFSIEVHPDDSDLVWVGTNRGLYHTDDGGSRWFELGIAQPRVTSDAGASWSAAGQEAACSGQDCLPITASAGESHPNLRGLSVITHGSRTLLYAGLWDRGHANGQATGCNDGLFNDRNLDFYRGGPWVSEDGGRTWDWLMLDDAGNPVIDHVIYRCHAGASERFATTFLPFVIANPSDPGHLFLGGWGQNGGLYEVKDGQWTWVSDPATADFEGGSRSSQGISGHQLGPYAMDLKVQRWGNSPSVLLAHSRGILQAERKGSTWKFHNLAHTPEGDGVWTGHGLDNACFTDLAFEGDVDGVPMLAGIADGAVLRSDASGSWRSATDSWATEHDVRPVDSFAVVRDPDTDVFYAINHDSATRRQTAFSTADGGESWTKFGDGVVGVRQLALALDHGSPPEQRRLLMGSEGEGLHLYSPGGGWSRPQGCPADAIVGEILTDPAWPEHAYATIDTPDPNRDGIYRVDLLSNTCERLEAPGACVACNPTTLAIAEDDHGPVLVAGGHRDFPRVWAAPFDPTDPGVPEWEVRLAPEDHLSFDDPYTPILENHLHLLRLSHVSVDPSDPANVLVSLQGSPYHDGFSAPQAFVSLDGARNFDPLENPPGGANIRRFVFSPDGAAVYALTACSSIWRADWPLG